MQKSARLVRKKTTKMGKEEEEHEEGYFKAEPSWELKEEEDYLRNTALTTLFLFLSEL